MALPKSASRLGGFVVNISVSEKVKNAYIMSLFSASKPTDKFAAIGSIQYGTTLLGLVPVLTSLGLYDPIKKLIDPICLSCFEFLWNSPFIQNLNAGGDTVPGIEYLMITSK